MPPFLLPGDSAVLAALSCVLNPFVSFLFSTDHGSVRPWKAGVLLT